MKCQECQQRPATLHFTKIINGEKTEFHICEQCAKEKGEHFPGSNSFSIHQLLSGLLDFEQPKPQDPQAQQTIKRSLTCEKCGMTYEQFARVGRFGCASCYQTFSPKLDPVFKRVHSGNVAHRGKVPKRIGGGIEIRRQIRALKETLKQHIEREEFEEAALVRDQIRSLERKVSGGEG
ncbi:UvrB/UvrC motif-containing protein [Halalkalibacterium halodurans]|uniref:UVR domain-containing protein n=1 Tax=Halalkalibacterium halodurans TaxID=86665 RepID=A0A0M0KCR5_ALKHA|nr:UvrB/UvrC motif-containing protein [Halalkalibacterium halodurans]MDY7220603.1 UvrB/UvrC motif-containing protein [Halalkalibacterium halodurans]MDY7239842.1 UvrB/UvrC motif-containing protein [Halalkalibacterium halodurans]MED3647639.1 UvrB/UvrC motif-containing protein [Halalkalibacterium halodurans]MED4081207.1 UvrB/UvrC motif-containing protein [Halalkalibacterium halodurans]MED4083922.1 UvrB/UvrC motif-containing protein [Halalkalibacterium halodurans]